MPVPGEYRTTGLGYDVDCVTSRMVCRLFIKVYIYFEYNGLVIYINIDHRITCNQYYIT